MSADHDFPLAAERRLTYLVCASKRTGSSLLCTGLISTGMAGYPTEYLSEPYGEAYKQRTGSDLGSYWSFLLNYRTSPNGVFGLKMHYDHLKNIPTEERHRFFAQFDRLIFLTRRDKIAQAISLWRADKSGVYAVPTDAAQPDNTPKVNYSFAMIAKALSMIAAQEAGWKAVLKPFMQKTLALTYEDLSSEYVETMIQVLDFLGLTEAIPKLEPQPRIRVQRDHCSTEWRRRFLSDACGDQPGPGQFLTKRRD
jgi:LPS sulfotransferase NodH